MNGWVNIWASVTRSATLHKLSESLSKVSTVTRPGGVLQAFSTSRSVSCRAFSWITSNPSVQLNSGTPNKPYTSIKHTWIKCGFKVAGSHINFREEWLQTIFNGLQEIVVLYYFYSTHTFTPHYVIFQVMFTATRLFRTRVKNIFQFYFISVLLLTKDIVTKQLDRIYKYRTYIENL